MSVRHYKIMLQFLTRINVDDARKLLKLRFSKLYYLARQKHAFGILL